jgi:TonB-dependent receptor
MRKIVFLFLIIFFVNSVCGHKIGGIVKDRKSGELLTGANIYLKELKKAGTTSGLDGSFEISDINPGKYTLVCSFISYRTSETSVEIKKNVEQKIEIALEVQENKLQDVIITGAKNTDIVVRNLERSSSNVINIISARSIELSPDITVAQVLGRMSGVVMERNSSGEGQYAILRGMDKRYNVTLINGVKIASPDNKQRYIPLDIFPGDLLDRLEVSKTQTAEKEGDATGGSVDMIMKDATDHFELRVNAATGYNFQYFDRDFMGYNFRDIIKTSPYELYGKDFIAGIADFGNKLKPLIFGKPDPNYTAGISVGNRFFNKKLGVVAAFSYQQMTKGATGFFYSDYMNQTASTVIVDEYEERTFDEKQIQTGIHLKVDYKMNAFNQISWFNTLISSLNPSVRYKHGTDLSLNYNPPSNANMSYEFRQRFTSQQIMASILQGEHRLNTLLNVNWSLVYSNAALQRPDQTYTELDNTRVNSIDNIFVDVDGNVHRWEHNNDQDFTVKLNANYKLTFWDNTLNLQAGGLFRTKNRDNFWIEYNLKPLNLSQVQGRDFLNIYDIGSISWYVDNPKGSLSPLDYEAHENIIAAYLQGKYIHDKLEIIAGLRTENTDQGYYMLMRNLVYGQEGSQQYIDFLPNIHLKYSPQTTENWRLSYYRSVNRPGFFEIVPYMVVNEDYTEYGNPDLKRAKIDNIDIRWEIFPKSNEQLMIGTFYKHISSPIEFAYFSKNDRQFGYGPRNLGNANNLGLEIDFIRYFRNFGAKFNYTYTYSAIKTPKVYYAINASGYTEKRFMDQIRPLVGQAAHVANISLLYKSTRHGVDAQIAAAYTGEKIIIASHFLNSDYWQKPSLQLDASAEKSIGRNLKVFLKVNNLLNTPSVEFIKTHNSENDVFPHQSIMSGETIIRKMYYNRNFLLGLRFRM